MIDFNHPTYTGNEDQYVLAAMRSNKLSGDGRFGRLCEGWFERALGGKKVFMTTSCTHSLEMAAMLVQIQPGDEVIMPSYTFVSTANAFVLRGAKIVFVDIRPDTMNMDETLVEAAINSKTKAIVPVHYAGIACEMDTIMDLANRHRLFVIEDAAQGMLCTYKGRQLGTIGDMGAYSFHETKNFTSGGEGGLLILKDRHFLLPAEILREKGTNRSQFFRGAVDKYTWVDLGSSYLSSDIQAAYLWGQLEMSNEITTSRLANWQRYFEGLHDLQEAGLVELPKIPKYCGHNGHMFYLKVKDLDQRTALLAFLKSSDCYAVFHYIPLHSAPAGKRFGRFHGDDRYTTVESERLIRLPMYYGLKPDEIDRVVGVIHQFFA